MLEEPCPIGPGDVLAQRYAVELRIGAGTFGWVLTALDLSAAPPCRVALKVLRHRSTLYDDALRRFERRELEILLRLQSQSPSPHVVSALVPRLLRHEDLCFLVLEFIDGPSLRERADAGRLPPAEVQRLGVGIARGLAAIHQAGGVHRDLKPSNIRLRNGLEPVIVDLGLTRALWETQEATEPWQRLLTPRYASPEQRLGLEVGTASDVYSLGVILYELLTGEPPPPEVPRLTVRPSNAAWAPALQPLRRRAPHALLARWTPDGHLSWSQRFGDLSEQQALDLAVDASGNLALIGTSQGHIGLGGGPLEPSGSRILFLAMFDPTGRQLWSTALGPSAHSSAALGFGPSGHLFVAATLGGGGTPAHLLVSRFEPSGRPVWSQRHEAHLAPSALTFAPGERRWTSAFAL